MGASTSKTAKTFAKPTGFFFILLVSIASITQWCSLPIGNTFLWWMFEAYVLYCFYVKRKRGYRIQTISLLFLLLAASTAYALLYQAQNYWDYKLLVKNLLVYSLPLVCYLANDPVWVSKLMRYWIKYAIVILVVLSPFLESDAYGKYLVPFTFLALFLPVLPKEYKIGVLLSFVVMVLFGRDSRSDTLKFLVTILLGSSMYILGFSKRKIRKEHKIIHVTGRKRKHSFYCLSVKVCHVLLLVLPVILIGLASAGVFNIFSIGEDSNISSESYNTDDTRTFIYYEELNSALDHNYYIQGRSIARGYDSSFFQNRLDYSEGMRYGERQSCEVSILNVFNYFGIIGVLLFFVIFAQASYKAIYQSNNHYLPLIGLYVAFRWVFGFIEDFTKFDLNIMFLWMMIGMCYSPVMRRMSDQDIIAWITSMGIIKRNTNVLKHKSNEYNR